MIPHQVNKDWCFDSCQIRQIAKHLNKLVYVNSLNKNLDSLSILSEKQIQYQKDIIVRKDKIIENQEFIIKDKNKQIKKNKITLISIIGVLTILLVLK